TPRSSRRRDRPPPATPRAAPRWWCSPGRAGRRSSRGASVGPPAAHSFRETRGTVPSAVMGARTAVTELMAAIGHEQVVFVADPPSGLRAIIAVHSTALGPSLGGIRFWRYPSEQDALLDVLRLSEAMSLKASAAGLHQGGGKAVVLWEVPDAPRSEAL